MSFSEDELICDDCDCGGYDCRNIPKPKFYCVSLYMVDRAYGGHEEGGWWFDCGEPCLDYSADTRIFDNEDDALEYLDTLQGKANKMNKGRYEISSVLSDGQFRAIMDCGHYPQPFPERKPRYE